MDIFAYMKTIGVLDSGIGGLSTCYYIFRQIPQINIIYYADNKNAPYGNKSEDEVYRAVRLGVTYLIGCGCTLIVLACNTATACAVSRLRKEFSVQIVGTEPAVKQAEKAGGSILYLATPLTVKSKNTGWYDTADTSYLAPLIESFCCDEKQLERLTNIVLNRRYDNVVLGCTHYPYLAKYIKTAYPETRICDGGEGVARQVRRLYSNGFSKRGGRLFLHFSGDKQFAKYLSAYKYLLVNLF